MEINVEIHSLDQLESNSEIRAQILGSGTAWRESGQ